MRESDISEKCQMRKQTEEDGRPMLQNGKITYTPAYTSLLIAVLRSEQDFT